MLDAYDLHKRHILISMVSWTNKIVCFREPKTTIWIKIKPLYSSKITAWAAISRKVIIYFFSHAWRELYLGLRFNFWTSCRHVEKLGGATGNGVVHEWWAPGFTTWTMFFTFGEYDDSILLFQFHWRRRWLIS